MDISFDPLKSNRNEKLRSLPFIEAINFDFQTVVYHIDDRHDYPEKRIIAVGYLKQRLHVLCFTEAATGIRIISFRKANAREVKYYEKAITPN